MLGNVVLRRDYDYNVHVSVFQEGKLADGLSCLDYIVWVSLAELGLYSEDSIG